MTVDRRTLPAVDAAVPIVFPAITRDTVSSGARVWTVDHHERALVTVGLLVPCGAAADPPGLEGLAGFTGDLLDDGTTTHAGIDLHDAVGRIGGRLAIDVGADATVLAITALARHAREALALLLEVATEPRFDAADVERVRALRTSRIAQLRHAAGAVADRVFVEALYRSHPYGHPAIGTAPGLARIGHDDLRAFHTAHYTPARWTVVAAGDIGPPGMRALATELVGRVAADRRPAGAPAPPADPAPPAERLWFVPREGAVQAEIRIGQLGIPRRSADYHPLLVLNTVLGGQFVSRLNLNLREEKGYTYGVRSSFDTRRGRGPFAVRMAVDAAATTDAIGETVREIREIRDRRPVREDELAVARSALTLGFPRGFETAGQVAHAALQLALYDLPDDEHTRFVPRVEQVRADDVTDAARRHLDPDRLVAVVVGPPVLRDALADLGFGAPVDALVD